MKRVGQIANVCRRRAMCSFPKDENSKFKYWEHEYEARNARKGTTNPYYRLYESMAKQSSKLSHVDDEGRARMVDVSGKQETRRTALATARIRLGAEAFSLVRANAVKKGDVLSVSQLAGVMGAKRTSDLIPLCHPIALTSVDMRLKLSEDNDSVLVECEARCDGKTGVEMEALVGASVAALTVYDMCKAVDKGIVIEEVRLARKTGGKSGDYVASDDKK